MSIRVIIATTEGPVTVQRITMEDPDLQSVVCLNGTTRALPISGDYDAFVRPPTGMIQDDFEQAAYRLDLSDTIDQGFSWQLGAYAAHMLYFQKELAQRDEPTDAIWWLTGQVDRDHSVRSVEHIQEKLQESTSLFREWINQGIPVHIFVPQTNYADVDQALLDELASPDLIAVHAIEQVDQLPSPKTRVAAAATLPIAIEPDVPVIPVTPLPREVEEQPKKSFPWLKSILSMQLLVLGGLIWFTWQQGLPKWIVWAQSHDYAQRLQLEQALSQNQCDVCKRLFHLYMERQGGIQPIKPPQLTLERIVIGAPPSVRGCREVHHPGPGRDVQPEVKVLRIKGENFPSLRTGRRLCQFKFRVVNGEETVHTRLLVVARAGKKRDRAHAAEGSRRWKLNKALDAEETLIWNSPRIGPWIRKPWRYRIMLLAAHAPLDTAAKWLKQNRRQARQSGQPWQWKKAQQQLAERGVQLLQVKQLLKPMPRHL
ncbi:hypothetical protein [Magnetococcus sp. PR-3]|uniref:hypothetical protein n=1 Tax=Magnetococcus sp. PR-3 TaxID=3120355 RepID=UPI002FCE2819